MSQMAKYICLACLGLLACTNRFSNRIEELAASSRNSGLALMAISADRVMVIPFDEEPRFFFGPLSSGTQLSAAVGNHGHMIVWARGSLAEGTQFVIEQDGERIARTRVLAAPVVAGSLNEETKRILFWGFWPSFPST